MTPQRIQRKRTKGWRLPANARCVTRPGVFGNPFTGADGVETFRLWLAGGRASAGERFTFLTARRAKLLARLPELRGKDLACYCQLGSPCHADVLLELANGGAQ